MSRKKIFFLAHEISPNLGSECSSGWNISRGLAKYHDLTIVFAKTNQFETENYDAQINDYFTTQGIKHDAKYIAVPQPTITQFIARINKFFSNKKSSTGNSFLYFLAYKFWQKKAYNIFLLEHKSNNFDIVHQFNSLSFREPGFLYKANLPLIWGPVSGLDKMPFSFLLGFPFPMLFKNFIRNLSNDVQFHTSNRIRKTIVKAKKIYAVTKMDFQKLYKLNSNTINLLDVGAIINNNQESRVYNPIVEKLRCIWVGRLDRLKALDILINSIHQSEILKQNIEILIVGDGIYKDEYLTLTKKYELNNFNFMGSVNKLIVDDLMKKSHILIHTSIKEAASAVILEGLASGLPIVCHDAFGMSHAITENCGFKVKFSNKEESVAGFKRYLETFLENPSLVYKLSQGSYRRAKELSWDGIIQRISNDYLKISN
jgi:glycosyltransferase involved in cell wall biosynthesis